MKTDVRIGHVYGGSYWEYSARPLSRWGSGMSDSAESDYKAALVVTTDGDLEVAWWVNADEQYVNEDGDGLPGHVLRAWAEEVEAMAREEGSTDARLEAMLDVAEYLRGAADKADETEED